MCHENTIFRQNIYGYIVYFC
uniref:Uncharacterized protein n=1 Tax=Anguilla anguilla TaxID=7936 RepID=A0A0E9U964_ANGAN